MATYDDLMVDIGNAPNDDQGDPLRTAFDKINQRFAELRVFLNNRGDWAPSTVYTANPNRDWVIVDGVGYLATSNHTSGATFAADLAAGKWVEADALLAIAEVDTLRADLASTAAGKGAALVAVTGGIGGTAFTTVTGFVTRILSSVGSALVGFVHAGVGAVMRSVQDKLRDAVSLQDFGAVGDGITDDTAAIQAAINAYPSNRKIDGGGRTYKVSATIKIPNNSRFLTLSRINIAAVGDITVLSSNSILDLISFFRLEHCLIDVSGHTTIGRAAINYSCFAKSTFADVWVFGAAGKTDAFYGTCTNAGAAPYYNVWENCYFGGMRSGIFADDAAGVPQTANSNTVSNCRFQPGAGNFGAYIGNNNQNWRLVNNVFEAVGGTGIYMSGVGCLISGNRFESMTTGVSYASNAVGCTEVGNYYDSNTNNLSFAGNAIQRNTVLVGSTDATGVTSSAHGAITQYSTGSQNTHTAFGQDFGTNNSAYTSNTNLTPSTNWRHFTGLHTNGGGVSYIVYGNGNIVNTNNSYGGISDARLKDNITDTSAKLHKLLRVRVRDYTLKADPDQVKQIGVIAQELEDVFPGVVETDAEGMKSVKYSVFVPILIKAMQELAAEVEALKSDKVALK